LTVINAGYWFDCVVSLVVHEAGHICAARAMGLHVKRIGISWRGPFIVRETGSPIPDAIVCAAGPFINLVLAALMWRDWPSFALVNLVLGLTNLLPMASTDGGRLLRALSMAKTSARTIPAAG
jgi:Zn-dependent protease